MNLFKANRISLTRPACPISLLSQHLSLLSRSTLLLLWALMAHQRHVQGHLHVHAHAGLGRLCQHHPTVSRNESGCAEPELMPPQPLKRSRRRAHNVAPAVLCRAAARRNRLPPASFDGRPDAASPSSRWRMGGGTNRSRLHF